MRDNNIQNEPCVTHHGLEFSWVQDGILPGVLKEAQSPSSDHNCLLKPIMLGTDQLCRREPGGPGGPEVECELAPCPCCEGGCWCPGVHWEECCQQVKGRCSLPSTQH